MAMINKQRTKALCKICHDGYADENFSFGRCCGVRMVEIPQDLWDSIDQKDRNAVDRAIEVHGVYLIS